MKATVAIFFALCRALLRGENGIDIEVDNKKKAEILDALFVDASLMCGTLEKLLQFDNRVVPLLIGTGMLEKGFNDILPLIFDFNKKQESPMATLVERNNGTVYRLPPVSTPLDRIVSSVCRILILLVAQLPGDFSTPGSPEPSNLHRLPSTVVKELGEDASMQAAGVFEAHMSAYSSKDTSRTDLNFVLEILDYFSKMTACACYNGGGQPNVEQVALIVVREAVIISMLKTVLKGRSLARDVFRDCSGFDIFLGVILSLEGVVTSSGLSSEGKSSDHKNAFLGSFATSP